MSTELRRELMPHKDFITDEQEQVFVIKKDETYRLLSDSKYSPIFEALNRGPLTLKELVVEYNRITESPKKQTSIYNYLMDLINKNLIIKSGQRIISGKTATEVLYGRRAKLYYSTVMTEEYWKTGQGKSIISKIYHVLNIYTLSEGLSEENLTTLFHNIFSNFQTEVGKIFDEHSDEIAEIVSPLSFSQLSRTTSVLNILIMVLNSESFEVDLKKCFPSKLKDTELVE